MRRRFITFNRIIATGFKNFFRNLTLGVAAMAVMIVTLTIVLFSVVSNAAFSHTITTITDQIDISVFLKDEVTPAQRDKLISGLKALPSVANVEYLSKEQALADFAKSDPNNTGVIAAAAEAGNTLPATIHVKPNDLNKIPDIEKYLTSTDNLALQTNGSPSYNGDRKKAIDQITQATNILQRIGIGAVAVFGLVSALIIFNTIQMAIFNRREELQIMRLLGATTRYIRGPFVVESILYGLVSGLVSIGIVDAGFATASSTLQASSLGLLDINYANVFFHAHFWILLTVQLAAGILLGAASSVIATRRYLKFRPAR